MKDLTERQQAVLDYILRFQKEAGYPPTHREIGNRFGITSTFGVKRHLVALEKKGYLNVDSATSRGLKVLHKGGNEKTIHKDVRSREISVIGRVAAGSPIQAIENIERTLMVDAAFLKKDGEYFGLKVKGDSMINVGICEGDIVIVHHTEQFSSHDIVVTLIDGEATVKRLEKRPNSIRLISENEKYQPIDLTGNENFSIIGKVVGVYRWLN